MWRVLEASYARRGSGKKGDLGRLARARKVLWQSERCSNDQQEDFEGGRGSGEMGGYQQGRAKGICGNL